MDIGVDVARSGDIAYSEAVRGARIDVRGLGKTFVTGVELVALRDISFSVEGNKFFSIIGASGCGKSTLLGIIAGYLRPTTGSVSVDNEQVTDAHSDRTVVFQEFALFPWMTASQNIGCALKSRGVSRGEWRDRTATLLELVNLGDFGDSYPYELSGGMKQRLAIARALAVEPKIILMDEPFASLDSQTRDLMQEEILRLWESTKKTILLVTHNIEEAVFLSDEVLVLTSRPGRVKELVPVPLSRPRDPEIRRSKEFQELVGHLWASLRSERHD